MNTLLGIAFATLAAIVLRLARPPRFTCPRCGTLLDTLPLDPEDKPGDVPVVCWGCGYRGRRRVGS